MSSKKRGANGGGSIRQRADGTWEARITLGTNPGTGKPVRKSIYGKTQKEIRQKMQKALVEVDEGIYTEQSKITLKQWMETWLAEFTGAVKDSTRTSYRQHMNNHIIPALGAVKLSELTPAACQKFINLSVRESRCLLIIYMMIHLRMEEQSQIRIINDRSIDCASSQKHEGNKYVNDFLHLSNYNPTTSPTDKSSKSVINSVSFQSISSTVH